jgi:hypothetical protein
MIVSIRRKNTETLRAYREASRHFGFRKVARFSRDAKSHWYLIADSVTDEVFDFVLRSIGQQAYSEYIAEVTAEKQRRLELREKRRRARLPAA